MDIVVFLAVITSAIFQASWNFFAKKSRADKTSIMAAGWLLFGLFLSPIALLTVDFSQFEAPWLKYSVASGFIHAFYVVFLGWAYTVGEISVVYPVARGLGIFWTTLASWALGLHPFSSNGIFGIIAIICGITLVGQKAMNSHPQRKAFLLAVVVSILISFYSLVDSAGAKAVPLMFYIVMMDFLTALFVLPFLFLFSPNKISTVFRKHKLESFLIGLGGALSYVTILWAFQTTAVSYVAALREVSVVIAAVLGFVFLKEEISKRKVFGILLVTLGAIFLKWS